MTLTKDQVDRFLELIDIVEGYVDEVEGYADTLREAADNAKGGLAELRDALDGEEEEPAGAVPLPTPST